MTTGGRFDVGAGLCAATLGSALGAASIALAELRPATTPKIDIAGTTLRVQLPDGSIREGASLIGATLLVAVGGKTIRVRIAGVEQDLSDPRGEILLYDFRLLTPNGEEPLCAPDPEGHRLGFPLAGRSDSTGFLAADDSGGFELVCTSGAQGKCVRMGYSPWRNAPDGRPLRDWYNACVRMLRGDYCGDGRTYTRDGTIIDTYDHIGVQTSDGGASFSFEAGVGTRGRSLRGPHARPRHHRAQGACPRVSASRRPAWAGCMQ